MLMEDINDRGGREIDGTKNVLEPFGGTNIGENLVDVFVCKDLKILSDFCRNRNLYVYT